jgi:hypothetical protein
VILSAPPVAILFRVATTIVDASIGADGRYVVVPLVQKACKDQDAVHLGSGPKKNQYAMQYQDHRCEPAFAISFHKLQGATLGKLILSLASRSGTGCLLKNVTFEQLYVGLSRVTLGRDLAILSTSAESVEYLAKLKPSQLYSMWDCGYPVRCPGSIDLPRFNDDLSYRLTKEQMTREDGPLQKTRPKPRQGPSGGHGAAPKAAGRQRSGSAPAGEAGGLGSDSGKGLERDIPEAGGRRRQETACGKGAAAVRGEGGRHRGGGGRGDALGRGGRGRQGGGRGEDTEPLVPPAPPPPPPPPPPQSRRIGLQNVGDRKWQCWVNTAIQLALHMEAESGRDTATTGPMIMYNSYLSRSLGAISAEQVCLAPDLLDSANASWREQWAQQPLEAAPPDVSVVPNVTKRNMATWVENRLANQNLRYGDPGDLFGVANSPLFTRFENLGILPDWLQPPQIETLQCQRAPNPCSLKTTRKTDDFLLQIGEKEAEGLLWNCPTRSVTLEPGRGDELRYCHFCGFGVDINLPRVPVVATKKYVIRHTTKGLLAQVRPAAQDTPILDLHKSIFINDEEYIVTGAAVMIGRHWTALCKEGETWWHYNDEKVIRCPSELVRKVAARYVYIQKKAGASGVADAVRGAAVRSWDMRFIPMWAAANPAAAQGDAGAVPAAAVGEVCEAVERAGVELVSDRDEEDKEIVSVSHGVGGHGVPGVSTSSAVNQAAEFASDSEDTGDAGDYRPAYEA